jgi:hypothetical protein
MWIEIQIESGIGVTFDIRERDPIRAELVLDVIHRR